MKNFALIASVFLLLSCQTVVTKTTDQQAVPPVAGIVDVSPIEAQTAVAKAYSQFIDVRTTEEYAGGHAERAENFPLDSLPTMYDHLRKDEPVYIICQTGNRSKKAAEMMKEAGFKSIYNVSGGTVAWQAAGLPMSTKPPHNLPPKKP